MFVSNSRDCIRIMPWYCAYDPLHVRFVAHFTRNHGARVVSYTCTANGGHFIKLLAPNWMKLLCVLHKTGKLFLQYNGCVIFVDVSKYFNINILSKHVQCNILGYWAYDLFYLNVGDPSVTSPSILWNSSYFRIKTFPIEKENLEQNVLFLLSLRWNILIDLLKKDEGTEWISVFQKLRSCCHPRPSQNRYFNFFSCHFKLYLFILVYLY